MEKKNKTTLTDIVGTIIASILIVIGVIFLVIVVGLMAIGVVSIYSYLMEKVGMVI